MIKIERNNKMFNYSEKELILLEYFGYSHMVGSVSLSPIDVYKLMMEKAFLTNDQSKYSRALRRCIKAINKVSPYRLTPEWDALIDID